MWIRHAMTEGNGVFLHLDGELAMAGDAGRGCDGGSFGEGTAGGAEVRFAIRAIFFRRALRRARMLSTTEGKQLAMQYNIDVAGKVPYVWQQLHSPPLEFDYLPSAVRLNRLRPQFLGL